MHVVITVNAAWNVLNFRRPIVDSLIGDGHRVTVLAPADESIDALREAGVEFIDLPLDRKGLNPLAAASLVPRFVAHFRSLAPDVVLSYTIKNNLFGALAARITGTPFIPNVSGLGTAFLQGGVLRLASEQLYRAAFARLPTVFFQNEDDRDLFLTRKLVRAGQARLLPGSGIDLGRFAPCPIPDGEPVFLFIGRLLRDKGLREFVAAARPIRSAHPAARFRLLGAIDADNRGGISFEQVRAWTEAGDVEWLGVTDDVRPHIERAHCVVLPSYREGAPRTLIEAAAMARPIIATDVPGCRQVVESGQTGFLCAARDAGALAERMRAFLDLDPAERAAMGQAGRRKMECEYDQRIVVEAYRKAIHEVVAGH